MPYVRCALLSVIFSIMTFAQQPSSASAAYTPDVDSLKISHTYEMVPNLTYASPDGIDLKADLYLPQGTGPFAGAVFVHGGGWSSGDRKQLQNQAAFLASHGVVGLAIEYRLSHQAKYPAPLDDTREAVRWLRSNAAKYRIDPNRIFAVGSSAGGYLAAMLGTVPSDAESRVAAVVVFNPVLDLTRMKHQKGLIVNLLGKPCDEDPEVCKQASPLLRVSSGSVPFLILHGTADETVPYEHAVNMVQALRFAGVKAELFTAQDEQHAFWANPGWLKPTNEAAMTFLQKQGLLGTTTK